MHPILEKIQRDHVNLVHLLNLLEQQMNSFFAGEETDFNLEIELLDYLESYAELVHHPMEDLIFKTARPLLKGKERVFDKLHEQHNSLIGLARKFRTSLEGVINGAVQSRQEVDIEAREFIALQRLHLELEEREIMPLLDGVLNEINWKVIEKLLPKASDPLFGKRDPKRFRTLIHYLETSGVPQT